MPDRCAAVLGILLSQGAIQKMVDRVSEAIMPHDTAMGAVARTAPVHDMDETAWLLHGDRQGRWVRANPAVAYVQIPPNRAKAAFVQLLGDWRGLLVSDGYRL